MIYDLWSRTVLSLAGKTLEIVDIFCIYDFLFIRNYDYMWKDEECWGSGQQARGVLCQK